MQDTSPEGAVDEEQSPPAPPKDSLAVGMVRLSHILPGLSHNQALPNVAAHTENEKEANNKRTNEVHLSENAPKRPKI